MEAWVIKTTSDMFYTGGREMANQGPLNEAKLYPTLNEARDYYSPKHGETVVKVEVKEVPAENPELLKVSNVIECPNDKEICDCASCKAYREMLEYDKDMFGW